MVEKVRVKSCSVKGSPFQTERGDAARCGLFTSFLPDALGFFLAGGTPHKLRVTGRDEAELRIPAHINNIAVLQFLRTKKRGSIHTGVLRRISMGYDGIFVVPFIIIHADLHTGNLTVAHQADICLR